MCLCIRLGDQQYEVSLKNWENCTSYNCFGIWIMSMEIISLYDRHLNHIPGPLLRSISFLSPALEPVFHWVPVPTRTTKSFHVCVKIALKYWLMHIICDACLCHRARNASNEESSLRQRCDAFLMSVPLKSIRASHVYVCNTVYAMLSHLNR